jgi:uncharacterized protein YceH (UPF0502 family)
MKIKLNSQEARIIGSLIEKEITTPDQYPLSLNALTNACNQKSNRDPVMELTESAVQTTVDGLIKKYLVRAHSGFGSRVTKYQHRLCNTEFGQLKLSPLALAIVCELLLRGPQTPGELRTRCERLCRIESVGQIEAELHQLMERDEPLTARLPRQAGKREHRYAHLLGEEHYDSAPAGEDLPGAAFSGDSDRLDRLEAELRELQRQVAELKGLVDLLVDSSSTPH